VVNYQAASLPLRFLRLLEWFADDDARPVDCEYGSVTAMIGICRSSEPFVSKASFDWARPITKPTTDISAATGLALEAHPTVG